jgi:hypothetical protein
MFKEQVFNHWTIILKNTMICHHILLCTFFPKLRVGYYRLSSYIILELLLTIRGNFKLVFKKNWLFKIIVP